MVRLLEIIEITQRLLPTKWHLDVHHFAESIGVTTDEANGFIKCIEDGGTGSKSNGTWQSNPVPYKSKINLTSQIDNELNFHCKDHGRMGVGVNISSPSSAILDQGSRFVQLGRVSTQ